MTLDEIIKLFEELENGNENIPIGFHLHDPIRDLMKLKYSYTKTFSDLLKELKEHENPLAIRVI